MALLPITKSFHWISFGIMIYFIVGTLEGTNDIYGEVVPDSKNYDNERLFRMNKINVIFQKAKRILPKDDLPKLYSELALQDRLEIEWKKQKASGLDENGEQEALIRRKFLGILNQFGLLEIYGDDIGQVENNVLQKEQTSQFTRVLKKDKKLAKLWKKAELSAFSDQELETLKVEFGHHLQKVEEYEQLKREIDRIEGLSDNSVQRFKTGAGDQGNIRNKHADLKKAYHDLKQSYESLEHKTANSPDVFKDPRIGELWSLALKSNLTAVELESFRTELQHFEHKINKHEYFLKEAAVAKANIHLQGKVTESPEFRQQMEQRVEDYALKIKKWYTELKMRLAKSPNHPEL